MSNATRNMQQFMRPIDLPVYREHNKIQDYMAMLENALESRNREISELRAALKREKTKTLRLRKENRKLQEAAVIRSE